MIEKLPDKLEKALHEMVSPGETVHVKLKGAWKEGLICTDRRVIILKAGIMTGQTFGNDAFQQPYSNIAGVQVKFNLMSGYFEMSAGGMQNTTKSYWSSNKNTDPAKAPNCVSLNSKDQARRFREACSFIMQKIDEVRTGGQMRASVAEAAPTVATTEDVFATLEKLGKLRDSGVVTEEEFQSKKAELLGRI